MDKQELEKYLTLFKISEGRYIIGIFQQGMSVVKQQTRALNIFHALVETHKIKKERDFKVCVIGGGIAGLTFASAALNAGMSVTIVEKNESLLHFQKECCTRHLHPNIYEWPDPGSLYPHAILPILSWERGIANTVVVQLEKEFYKQSNFIKTEFTNQQVVNIYLNRTVQKVQELEDQSFDVQYLDTDKSETFNLIVYAVGFGVEKGENPNTVSYWRNDSLEQSHISNFKQKYVLSGMGDGGIIDYFRLRISSFSYGYFIEIMKRSVSHYAPLVMHLREIKKNAISRKSKDYCFNSFEKLEENSYSYITDTIQSEGRFRDTEIILNGESTFPESLDNSSISFLNSFIAYVLYKQELRNGSTHFKYIQGRLIKSGANYLLSGKTYDNSYIVITRHGTKQEDVINELVRFGENHKALTDLRKAQKDNTDYSPVKPVWSYSEIHRSLYKNHYKNFHYISPKVVDYFTKRVNSISKNLRNFTHSQQSFKITIHKLVFIDKKPFVQQVAPYYDYSPQTGISVNQENIGQTFSVNRGNVGYSIRHCEPTLIVRHTEKEFAEIAKNLSLGEGYPKYKFAHAYHTIPLLSSIEKNIVSNLVIYIETPSFNLFSDEVLIYMIDIANDLSEEINSLNINNYDVIEGESIKSLELPNRNSERRRDNEVIKNQCWEDIKHIYNGRNINRLYNFNLFDDI